MKKLKHNTMKNVFFILLTIIIVGGAYFLAKSPQDKLLCNHHKREIIKQLDSITRAKDLNSVEIAQEVIDNSKMVELITCEEAKETYDSLI